MNIRDELIDLLKHNPGSTIPVPRSLLKDALNACHGPAEEALATQRAECDADDQPWVDDTKPPLVLTGQGSYEHRYTPKLSPPSEGAAVNDGVGDGAPLIGGAT